MTKWLNVDILFRLAVHNRHGSNDINGHVIYCRAAERARLQEYRRQLNEMKERVETRPLLFERTSQVTKTTLFLFFTHLSKQ